MQLLNVSFAILLIKMAICILPGVLGIFLIGSSEEKKRGIRNTFCIKVFGIRNVIPYAKFERALYIAGGLMIAFSIFATWFLILRRMF